MSARDEATGGWTLTTHARIDEIAPADWDLCANPPPRDAPAQAPDSVSERPDPTSQIADSNSQEETYNPFISFDFLNALETSGCIGGPTGWQSAHQALRDAERRLVAVIPTYVKSHSLGEYVFDHGWAQAYENAGGRYYPKLQVAVPFTPVTGRRLLIRPEVDRTTATAALAAGLEHLAARLDASSVHATFLTGEDAAGLHAHGYLERIDRQFHWLNQGFASFEDFLATLASRKRKMIRRERADALATGLTIRRASGRDIRERDWDAFFAFYQHTGARKWGRPYLNRRFFSELGARLADRILLVFAERAGQPIAGALNLIGDKALYGRNWGAIEEHPFLHFEVCYYQAIDFAIQRGLIRVEAGAQGEHKLLRGYQPVTMRSAHLIRDPGLARAVARYLAAERDHLRIENEALYALAPFRKT